MAFTGLADDYSAAYYNPAGLTFAPRSELAAGYILAAPNLHLDLTPADFATDDQRAAIRRLARDQRDVDALNGYFVGLSLHITDYLAGGIGVFLPEGFLFRLEPSSSRVPSFQIYENHSQRVVVLIAGAFRPIHQLSIGAGVSLLANADGVVSLPVALDNRNLSLDPGVPAEESLNPDAKLRIDFPLTVWPFAGVLYKPLDWLSIGASYKSAFALHARIDVDADLRLVDYVIDLDVLKRIAPDLFPLHAVVSVDIPGVGKLDVPVSLDGLEGALQVTARLPLEAMVDFPEFWTPQQVTLGLAFHPTKALAITVDGVWQNWSAMPAPDLKVEIEDLKVNLATLPTTLRARIGAISLPVIGTIGPLPPVDVSVPGIDLSVTVPIDIAKPYAARARDVVIPRIGFEYALGPSRPVKVLGRVAGAVRAGYAYEPSHLAKPNGFSNLIDLDRHIATLGAGVTIHEFVSLDAYGQYHYLVPISADRTFLDPSAPYTKLTASGNVLAAGAMVKVVW
jgi:long-subunit fatty acid transport protein